MKQAIGSVPMYNIIIVFIVLTFGFLMATLSYMKAFKVNGRIAKALENYEGYNTLSDREIYNTLSAIGYRTSSPDNYQCPTKKGKEAVAALPDKNHYYCIYQFDYYQYGNVKTKYFNYGVLTYIFVDLPFGFKFQLPVYSETEKIFHFTD